MTTLLSFKGRTGRWAWWWSMLALAIAFVLLFQGIESTVGRTATWILYPPAFWIAAAVSVKRLHDRAHSAWALLWALLPILGVLWLLLQLALLPGTRGENQYGPDPLDRGLDYLVVQ